MDSGGAAMRGLILVIIALILSAIILPIGFVVGIIAALDKYLFRIAKSIDQLGNVVCAELFDWMLVKKGKHFGNEDETISSVLGRNIDNLTIAGKALVWLLNAIEKDHVQKAIGQ